MPPLPKVQQNVNRIVAEFMAWSFRCCAAGVMPSKGFYDEEFPKGSMRCKLAGKTLAGGFRTLSLLIHNCFFSKSWNLYGWFTGDGFRDIQVTPCKTVSSTVSLSHFFHLRTAYFAAKADLKARRYMRDFSRYYRCGMFPG